MRESTKQGIALVSSLLGTIAVATALAQAVRLNIVEPDTVAQSCATTKEGFVCAVREFAVWGFLNNVFGWAAVIFGLLAIAFRWRWLALIAIVSGVTGAVLYTYELSGVGLLLGSLAWIQRSPLTRKNYEAEHRA